MDGRGFMTVLLVRFVARTSLQERLRWGGGGACGIDAAPQLQGASHESSTFQHRMLHGGQRKRNSHTEKDGQSKIKTQGWRMKKRTE